MPSKQLNEINVKVLTALFEHYNGGKVAPLEAETDKKIQAEMNKFNQLLLKTFVECYCWHGDDNSRLDFQNTVMYALQAPNQEVEEVKTFWKQFEGACQKCGGNGKVVPRVDKLIIPAVPREVKCLVCKGTGKIPETKDIQQETPKSVKTELCWSCTQQKPVAEFDSLTGKFDSRICQPCRLDFEKLLKDKKAKIVIKDRKENIRKWQGEYEMSLKDVYVKVDGKEFFINGYNPDEFPTSTQVFGYAKQFVKNNCRYFYYHGNFEALMKDDFWFRIEKAHDGFYHFGGNVIAYSGSFSMKTLDLDQIFAYIEAHTPLTQETKKVIRDGLEKGWWFLSYSGKDVHIKQFSLREYLGKKDQRTDQEKYKTHLLSNEACPAHPKHSLINCPECEKTEQIVGAEKREAEATRRLEAL